MSPLTGIDIFEELKAHEKLDRLALKSLVFRLS